MSYKLFDKDGQEVSQHDLQDKGAWCKTGLSQEEAFVELFGRKLGLIMNPEKKTNPFAPDLFNTKSNQLADLKTQNTPFFQAKSRFNLDPQYTVVFNKKDRDRYQEMYPNIEIYFAVDWLVTKFAGYSTIEVQPMFGIWYIPFTSLDALLEKAPLHPYLQRTNDNKGNAKESYILNLLDPSFLKLL